MVMYWYFYIQVFYYKYSDFYIIYLNLQINKMNLTG